MAQAGRGTRMTPRSPTLGTMSDLTHEQQVFVQHQIRNWVFGRYEVFKALNLAWSVHGAEAYFWN